MEKLGERMLQIGKREFTQDAGKGDGVGDSFIETKKSSELFRVEFRPSLNFGEGGDVGKES